ncbi:sensor domain-containing diguanylate cyclase [Pseudoalteromonas sp. G4]|uniref:sensor domain-containing diguanylate cyclase n=1 Tax=Pseudoalteromonas sp. G4 TaxID=2992761 RepID=UPI00237D4F5E|nr:GGDEF domain-containing protein [Pseudoalteromonas sp. G4]MDE3272526.1 diguanylate cyclase [Pseudoalteromonas sp. G4]
MTAELKKRVAILEGMLSIVGACIFSKDLEGRYTYVNQAVLDVFDLPEEEVLGKDDSHFFDLAQSREVIENDQMVMRTGKILQKEETNFVKAFNREITYQIIKKPLYDENNNLIGVCGIANDITEQRQLQSKVEDQNKLLDIVLDNVAAHIYMKDDSREFIYVNAKVSELFGLPVEQIIGAKEQDILPPEMAAHFHESDSELFVSGVKQTIEETVSDDDGNTRHYLSVKVPFEQHGRKSLIGFSTEVTELYQLKEQFRKQANTDYLTNLYNRRYFVETAEREFKRAERSNAPFALMSLDIDHFKKINDKHGHPIGDVVLQSFATSLSANLRDEDVLARIGGEEFAILLPNTPFEKAQMVAERIREYQASNPIKTEKGDILAKVSIGLVMKASDDINFETMFKRVDKALYQAKEQGRNRVVAHN